MIDDARLEALASPPPGQRHDGWLPERQQEFLRLTAEGYSVAAACGAVGMTPSSAYALRTRAAGAAFALGWSAARLIAREKLADTLLARAVGGQLTTFVRADGEQATRHQYDNRLAVSVLARLDRFAEAPAANAAEEADRRAARLVARDFDRFVDLVAADAGPAGAGLFLKLASGGDAAEMESAEQSPLCPLRPDEDEEAEDADEEDLDPPVWLSDGDWMTRFPPPPGFDGYEEGRYGADDYRRGLSPDEEVEMLRREAAEVAVLRAEEEVERDAFFGFTPPPDDMLDIAAFAFLDEPDPEQCLPIFRPPPSRPPEPALPRITVPTAAYPPAVRPGTVTPDPFRGPPCGAPTAYWPGVAVDPAEV